MRFVNVLLDMSMKNGYPNVESQNSAAPKLPVVATSLPLIGEQVTIRAFDAKEHESYLQKWLSSDDGQHFLTCRMTGEKADQDRLVGSDQNRSGIITLNNQSDWPIGLLAFINYDKAQGKAELRELIGASEYRGMGLLKEATRLWIQFGIASLNLKKIYLNSFDTNIRTIKLNEELGFRVEGILRNECCIDGKYHDVLKMGYIVK